MASLRKIRVNIWRHYLRFGSMHDVITWDSGQHMVTLPEIWVKAWRHYLRFGSTHDVITWDSGQSMTSGMSWLRPKGTVSNWCILLWLFFIRFCLLSCEFFMKTTCYLSRGLSFYRALSFYISVIRPENKYSLERLHIIFLLFYILADVFQWHFVLSN